MRLVVDHHVHAVIDKDTALRVHQQFAGVLIAGLHGDTLEVILTRVTTHAIDRRHPKPSLLVAEQPLHIIIRQRQGVLATEILVVLVTIVAVQAPEGANPQLSGGILGDTLHTAVRQFLGHHKVVLFVFVLIGILPTFLLTSLHHPRTSEADQDR